MTFLFFCRTEGQLKKREWKIRYRQKCSGGKCRSRL